MVVLSNSEDIKLIMMRHLVIPLRARSSSDDDSELANDINVEHFDITSIPFNSKLVEMDSVAKKLAEKFPRGFGAAYLATLLHGNSRLNFTPAIQVTAASVAALRFGDRGVNSRGKKQAGNISKKGAPRSRARGVMNTAAMALKKQMDWLVDTIDEVNKRPATRKYRQQPTNTPTGADPAVDLVLLESEIADLESDLCAKYRLRAAVALVGNGSSTEPVASPPQAVTLVAGPMHYYDATTMFQFTNNVPDICPLPKLFRALYSIRDDDIPQDREGTRSKKRERHTITSENELGQRKEAMRTASAVN